MADVFVPLNAFKSVVTSLTGEEDIVYTTPEGVSTIILSAQITNQDVSQNNNVTIKLDSNREIPVPQVQNIENTGSFVSSSQLLEINKTFLKKEATAYANFLNNLEDIPFAFTSSKYENYVDEAIVAVRFDIENGGTLRTKKEALSYYDKNGVRLDTELLQVTASYNTINYVNTLSQQILKNESVTGSSDVDRLYQTSFTQSFDATLNAESGSPAIVEDLLEVIANTNFAPVTAPQEKIELVKDFPIRKGDSFSPVTAGKLVMEEQFSLVVSGSTDLKVILSILESANE
jgi:hypothetical protein